MNFLMQNEEIIIKINQLLIEETGTWQQTFTGWLQIAFPAAIAGTMMNVMTIACCTCPLCKTIHLIRKSSLGQLAKKETKFFAFGSFFFQR